MLECPRRADLLFRDLGSEVVIYDSDRNRAHSLNRTASMVWRLCDGSRTIEQIASSLQSDLGIASAEELVLLTVTSLDRAGLLRSLPEANRSRATSRRDLLRRFAAAGGTALVLPVLRTIAIPDSAAAAFGESLGYRVPPSGTTSGGTTSGGTQGSTTTSTTRRPDFRCGPDITAELKKLLSDIRRKFLDATSDERNDACFGLVRLPYALSSWDSYDLHLPPESEGVNLWIKAFYPSCATPPCENTFWVDGSCNDGGSLNYVLYGVMNKLCFNWFDHSTYRGVQQSDFTPPQMIENIYLHKFVSRAANRVPSLLWAEAGYEGWGQSDAPTPGGAAGDCLQCPTAKNPKAGPLSFHWRGISLNS